MKTKSSKLKKPLNIKKSIASLITQNVAKEKKQLIKSDDSNTKDIISLILRDHEPIKKLILVLKDSEASIQKNVRPIRNLNSFYQDMPKLNKTVFISA
jgi:hypothetical protein